MTLAIMKVQHLHWMHSTWEGMKIFWWKRIWLDTTMFPSCASEIVNVLRVWGVCVKGRYLFGMQVIPIHPLSCCSAVTLRKRNKFVCTVQTYNTKERKPPQMADFWKSVRIIRFSSALRYIPMVSSWFLFTCYTSYFSYYFILLTLFLTSACPLGTLMTIPYNIFIFNMCYALAHGWKAGRILCLLKK